MCEGFRQRWISVNSRHCYCVAAADLLHVVDVVSMATTHLQLQKKPGGLPMAIIPTLKSISEQQKALQQEEEEEEESLIREEVTHDFLSAGTYHRKFTATARILYCQDQFVKRNVRETRQCLTNCDRLPLGSGWLMSTV